MMPLSDFFATIGSAANDIIDLYFVQSDLKNINITIEESTQAGFFDRLAEDTESPYDDDVPLGKQVW